MLQQVPQAVNHQTRMVTLYHPNAMDCVVWRKVVTRVEANPATGQPSIGMGMPTLGGMGVLKAEDESQYRYDELGPARCLLCGQYQPSDLNERDDAVLLPTAQQAQVECTREPTDPAFFTVESGDLVLIDMGLGVVMALEAVTETGSISIPPYTRRLVLNPRDDLHHLDPFTT